MAKIVNGCKDAWLFGTELVSDHPDVALGVAVLAVTWALPLWFALAAIAAALAYFVIKA